MSNFIYFFRHGESVANAGGVTVDNASIDLTPKGVEQAKSIARFFTEPPHQVISSPYLRARKTAENALTVHPGITIDIWPTIKEFSYLSLREGTTMQERLPQVKGYIESYSEIITRTFNPFFFREFSVRNSKKPIDFDGLLFCNSLFLLRFYTFGAHGGI